MNVKDVENELGQVFNEEKHHPDDLPIGPAYNHRCDFRSVPHLISVRGFQSRHGVLFRFHDTRELLSGIISTIAIQHSNSKERKQRRSLRITYWMREIAT